MQGPVAVIGLGLIGGSLARVLRARRVEVRAWSASAADREQAAAAGISIISDGREDGAAAATGAAIAVLAVPIDQVARVAATILPALGDEGVLLHVGSLQRQRALGADDALYERLFGTHPLAGSHEAGFGASRTELFSGAMVSVEERATPRVRAVAERLWRAAGATRFQYRSAEEHDRLMAWTSHLPQLASTALAHTLSGAGVTPAELGPGARDTTRLAASPLELWRGLLRAAPADLLDGLEKLETTLSVLRRAIGTRDDRMLANIWEPAQAWRRAERGGE